MRPPRQVELVSAACWYQGSWILAHQVEKMNVDKKSLFLLFGAIVFSFGFLEIGARVWLTYFADEAAYRRYRLLSEVPASDLQWSPHHYLNYYPTPNYRKGLTSHNSLGFRDAEFPLKKRQGTYRMVALGGSTTYTISVEDNAKTFTAQLGEILGGTYDYGKVEVINAGVGGYNSWESLINFEFRVLDLDPDLIIVYFGTNDVHARLVQPEAYAGDNSGRRQQWQPPQFNLIIRYSYLARIISDRLGLGLYARAGLGSLVNSESFRGSGSGYKKQPGERERLLDKNPPKFFERNIRSIVGVARAHGVDVLLATWAHSPNFDDYASSEPYQRGFRELNEIVRKVALDEGVYFFDFARVMPKDKELWSDGRHVNEAGARKKAGLFAEFINSNKLIE